MACYGMSLQTQIDSPLEAAIFYFPSPATMRCLNHSEIPRKFKKGIIYRKVKIPNQGEIEQTITIGISTKGAKKKFVLRGNIKTKDEILSLKPNANLFFNQTNTEKNIFPPIRLEDILGLSRKIRIKEKFGNQFLNYETFLKTTKGMIGNLDYKLELFGQDRATEGKVRYVLTGTGMLGAYNIIVSAQDIDTDSYLITEQYGPAQVVTTVRVYD